MVISARKRAVESPHQDSIGSILPDLPDDVAMICLARVPRKHLPVMGAVCKRWRSLIQSKELSFVRKESGMLEEWLYFFTAAFLVNRSHWEIMSSAQVEVWKIPPMPAGSVNGGFRTVVLDGKLLVIGGFTLGMGLETATADVKQYDARLNSWSMLAKMNFVRIDFACCEVNGLIYAVGGFGSDGFGLSSAEVYDPDKNEWSLIEKLRRPMADCFACSYGGKLYAMGASHVEVYSPASRSWCELKNRVITQAVVGNKLYCALWWELGKKLYCLHTWGLDIFDPADNSWRKVEMPYPGISMDRIRLGILDNKLLLFSWYDDPHYRTMRYDPMAPPGSEWSLSALRASAACLCTVTIQA